MFSQSKPKYTNDNNINPLKSNTKHDKTCSVWSLCSRLLFWDQWGLSLMSSLLPPATEPRPLFSGMNHQSACNPTKEWRNTCVLTKGTSAPMAQKRRYHEMSWKRSLWQSAAWFQAILCCIVVLRVPESSLLWFPQKAPSTALWNLKYMSQGNNIVMVWEEPAWLASMGSSILSSVSWAS